MKNEKKIKLTDKQEEFCRQYAIDFNATRACRAAGYTKNNSSELGYQLLQKDSVNARIAELLQEKQVRTNVTQDRVLLEMVRIAFSDPRKAFDENGNLLPIHLWPDEIAANVQSLKVNEITSDDNGVQTCVKEVKFWSKDKNIELLCRHMGMLNDKLSVEVINPAEELNKLEQTMIAAKQQSKQSSEERTLN